MPAKELTIGSTFGKWTVIGPAEPRTNTKGYSVPFILCRCECGTEREVRVYHLRNGASAACGCHKKNRIKHGYARRGGRFPKVYRTWRVMLRRCNDPKFPKYPIYGGRGITVCERWLDFNNFLADMGECPSEKHMINRIDNNGNYEPSNCRWADAIEQARNTRANRVYTVRGITGCLSMLCEHFAINYNRTIMRLLRGWDIDSALFVSDLRHLPHSVRREMVNRFVRPNYM